jgi:hypothetical protein
MKAAIVKRENIILTVHTYILRKLERPARLMGVKELEKRGLHNCEERGLSSHKMFSEEFHVFLFDGTWPER